MWRMRNDPMTGADGAVSKALRNTFIAEHCRAIWVPLPDSADIVGLERAVIELAPAEAIAWNRRSSDVYTEPKELVDELITRLGYGASEIAALGRQQLRYDVASVAAIYSTPKKATNDNAAPPFPEGQFKFFALDVETANHDRGSICQIGVACVRPDNTIETWVTYIDPQVDHWAFTYLHKIDAKTVRGAPQFSTVLPMLTEALKGSVIYQHSGFDRSAVAAACKANGAPEPAWNWQDSVQVARRAWPELKGNGGHGLASLKSYLGLSFEHHDAGEDARAAAEVVLLAEAGRHIIVADPVPTDDDYDVFEEVERSTDTPNKAVSARAIPVQSGGLIGRTTLTEGNIKNHHIYLSEFFDAFPVDAIGGSNAAAAALRTINVHWGSDNIAVTDLDGKKKFFRKRAWVREFFTRKQAIAGDTVTVERLGRYDYKIDILRA
jgi:DNA polymerase-3 subunit epsilon